MVLLVAAVQVAAPFLLIAFGEQAITSSLTGILVASAMPSAGSLAAMAALGVACTGVGFAIFHTLIADVGPARAMLVSYVALAFAVLYGATLLGEPVTPAAIVGLVLIVGGSWLGAGGGTARDDAAEPELMTAAATRRGGGRSDAARQAA